MKLISAILALALMATAATGCSLLKKTTGHAKQATADVRPDTVCVMPSSLTPDKINGEWTIVKVKETDVPQEDQMPYVNFEAATGRFYASNGCNILNGDFAIDAAGRLQLRNVASTMRFCPDVLFESEISTLLGGSVNPTVKVNRLGQESYITLTDNVTGLSLTGRRHNMDFLNGQWQIIEINGKAVDDEEANIFIDLDQMKVHGNTGCNYFNGDIYIDPSKSNSVEFGSMALTRMACPKAEQESAMMLALEETATAIKGDNGKVLLLKASGEPVIELRSQKVDHQ